MRLLLLYLACLAAPVWAERVSLLQPALFGGTGQALIKSTSTNGASQRSSLFAGRSSEGLFAPWTPRARKSVVLGSGGPISRLRDLIARAEAGPLGYDAVQHGARIKPEKPPTSMTISEIYAWIKDTPGQPHAIGRYQFIPATLRRLVDHLAMPPSTVFSPSVQDQLANQLLKEAGLNRMLAGTLPRAQFQDNLAKIWAGLPTADGTSHYDGYAGNKATITRSEFDTAMARIFPG